MQVLVQILSWIRTNKCCKALINEIAESSEVVYSILLGIYIAISLILKISWNLPWPSAIWLLRIGMTSAVLWGGTVYLFSILWRYFDAMKRRGSAISMGMLMFAVVFFFSRNMSQNAFNVVMDVFFCCMAYKKDYRRILRNLLFLLFAALVIATVGAKVGFTNDIIIYKPDRIQAIHSMGSIYPNTWGYIAFLFFLVFWYLYLRDRTALTFTVFWAVTLFMILILSCKTISLLSAVFPLMTVIGECFKKKFSGDSSSIILILKYFFTAFPIFMFTITMILCWQMDWVQRHFYQTRLLSFAMRFVEGGYALRQNKISLFGHELYFSPDLAIGYQDQITNFIDSPFIANLITKGLIWMIGCLLWLVYANVRCLRAGDYRLLMISTCMVLLAMMERPALDVWYNFVLLYPLATTIQSRDTSGKNHDQTQSDLAEPS